DFHHGADLRGEAGEDGVGLIGFAEEAAVDPGAEALREAADSGEQREARGDHQNANQHAAVLAHGGGGDYDGDTDQNLEYADAARGQQILDALANEDADVHGAVNDDGIGHGERKGGIEEGENVFEPGGKSGGAEKQQVREDSQGSADIQNQEAAAGVTAGRGDGFPDEGGDAGNDGDHPHGGAEIAAGAGQEIHGGLEWRGPRDVFVPCGDAEGFHDRDNRQIADDQPGEPGEAAVELEAVRKQDAEEHEGGPR